MTKVSYSALHEEINRVIKPKGGCPVGIKLFQDRTKFEELKVKGPKRQLALCQVLKFASVYERTIGVQGEDVDACVLGSYVLGFQELPRDLMGRWIERRNFTSNRFEKFVKNIHTLPMGGYKAALFSRLGTFEARGIDPDMVFIPVNSTQAYLLLSGYFDSTGDKISSDFNGHAACEIIAATKSSKKPWLTIPCGGTRSMAEVQDDELWVTMIPEQISRTMKRLKSVGARYPLAIAQMLEMSPDPEHPLTYLIRR